MLYYLKQLLEMTLKKVWLIAYDSFYKLFKFEDYWKKMSIRIKEMKMDSLPCTKVALMTLKI